MGSWTGTIPTFTAGQRLRASQLQIVADALTALTAQYTSYSPTTAGITAGNGVMAAGYDRFDKILRLRGRFTLGSTSAITGAISIGLPAGMTLSGAQAATTDPVGYVVLTDTGTATRPGILLVENTTTLRLWALSSTNVVTAISSTSPHTWANTDVVSWQSFDLELA